MSVIQLPENKVMQLPKTNAFKKAIVTFDNFENKSFEYREKSILDSLSKGTITVNNLEPVLIFKNDIKQICNDELIIKLNEEIDLKTIIPDYKFEIIPNSFIPNHITIQMRKPRF